MLEYMADKLKLSAERTTALKVLARARHQNVYGSKQPTTPMMAQEAVMLAEKVCADAEAWIKQALEKQSDQ